MRCVRRLVLAMALAAAVALTLLAAPAGAAVIKLRKSDDMGKLEGDSSEWVKELRKLQRVLPLDPEWVESINGFVASHRGEVLDVCNFEQVRCNVHHEPEALVFDDPIGVIAWPELPATVIFVTVNRGRFTDPFNARVPAQLQAVKYFHSEFGVKFEAKELAEEHQLEGSAGDTQAVIAQLRSGAGAQLNGAHLHELECDHCGLTDVAWDTLPPTLISLGLPHNNLTSVPFEHLPRTLRFLNLSYAFAQGAGADPWGMLPPALLSLDLSGARLDRIGDLPKVLETLVLNDNMIKSIELKALPTAIQTLRLRSNLLEGPMPDLSGVATLKEIDVSGNKVTALHLSQLPSTITAVLANNNDIDTPINFASLPRLLTKLEVARNKLSGTVDLTALPKAIDTLDLQGNSFSGPVDLTNLPLTMRFVYLNDNQFTGRPDLSRLPVDLRRIMFGNNRWTSLMPPK